ncbi:MAG: hypothetical protein GTO02_00685 [Candidatus Dadabacteria bacterium]|nr:hypothetical protein [Candidatus Dadabacteria bacterium]
MEIFLDTNLLSVVGRVVNCEEFTVDGVNKYNIGIEFKEIADDHKSILKNFLDNIKT